MLAPATELTMRVELLHTPDCPNVETTRRVVRDCLVRLGRTELIIERVGHFPSPTVLVEGVDVMGPGAAGAPVGDSCRLDVPTAQRVAAAVRAALSGGVPGGRR